MIDTGLAALPENWGRVQLRALSTEPVAAGVDWVANALDENTVRYIRTTDIVALRELIPDSEAVGIPPEVAPGATVQRDDLLLTRSGSLGTSLCYDSDEPAAYAGYLVRVRPNKDRVEPRYLAWWAASQDHLDQIAVGATRSTIDNFSASKFRAMRVPYPARGEQAAIADFLDRETAKIDALIDKQRALANALHERRKAALDAAIPWEGARAQLRRDLEFLTSGSRGWGDFYADEGDIFLRIGDLSRESYRLRTDDLQRVQIPAGAEGSRSHTKAGDLLFSITAYLGSVGVVSPDLAGSFVSQHVALARIRQRVWLPEFVAWCVLSGFGQAQLNEQAYGGTKMQLSLGDVRGIEVPVIPINTQRAVIKRLDHITSEIDSLTRSTVQLVRLAQERRSALITAAVTGQLDISGEAA